MTKIFTADDLQVIAVLAAFAAESKFLAQHVEAARVLRHKEEAHQHGEDLD